MWIYRFRFDHTDNDKCRISFWSLCKYACDLELIYICWKNLLSIFKSCFLKKKHRLYTLKTCSKIHFGRPIQVVPCILGQLHFWIHLLASIQLKKGQFLYVNFPSIQRNLIKNNFCDNSGFIMKSFYSIPMNWWKIYLCLKWVNGAEFLAPCAKVEREIKNVIAMW